MNIERQGSALPARHDCHSFLDIPPDSHETSTASLSGAVDSIGNSDAEIQFNFKPYPASKGTLSTVREWIAGTPATTSDNDAESQEMAKIIQSGAATLRDAENVRYARNYPPPATTGQSWTLTGKAGMFIAGVLLGAGAGWLARGYGTDSAAAGSADLFDGTEDKHNITMHYPDAALLMENPPESMTENATGNATAEGVTQRAYSTGRNYEMGQRRADWCHVERYVRNTTQNETENARSLYVSGDVLENRVFPLAENNTENAALATDMAMKQCVEQRDAIEDRGRFFQKWGNTPTNNELRDNEYIKEQLTKLDATIVSRDLDDLRRINPARYQRLRTVTSELLRNIDSAIASFQGVTNYYLDPRPKNDEHSAAVLPVIRAPSGETYLTRPIEDHDNEPADDWHNNFINTLVYDKNYFESLFMLMSKARSSLQRLYPDYGNNYLNFITVDHPESVKLYATTGNTALMREWIGYNMPNIILGNDFFSLSLYESMQEILQQLTYYYTGASELFSIMAEEERYRSIVDDLSTAEHKAETRLNMDFSRNILEQYNTGQSAEFMNAKAWKKVREAFGPTKLKEMIPEYPVNDTDIAKEAVIANYYRDNEIFRQRVNTRNANYLANTIMSFGNLNSEIDEITSPFGKKSNGC